VSHTTRPPRPTERDGQHYYFVSPQTFALKRQRGDFLESAEVHGNYYGTDRKMIEEALASGQDVLLALDAESGEYLAGVGIKRHDQFGHELSVGTTEAARGRGLARRLVAQAARFVVDNGRVATYLHDPTNTASAKVADAAGFPDRGWSIVGIG